MFHKIFFISECDDSYYGTNCLSSCGRCIDNVACHKSSGICPEGCQIWWITDTCQVEISEFGTSNESFLAHIKFNGWNTYISQYFIIHIISDIFYML